MSASRTTSFTRHMALPLETRASTSELIITTDASGLGQDASSIGQGYLVTNGLYGISAHAQPDAVVGDEGIAVGELRAVHLALTRVRQGEFSSAILLCDSSKAVEFMRKWQEGEEIFPVRYDTDPRSKGKLPSLVRLARVLAHDKRIQVLQVRGRSGHPLNTGADRLASLALSIRQRRITMESGLPAAERIVRAALKA